MHLHTRQVLCRLNRSLLGLDLPVLNGLRQVLLERPQRLAQVQLAQLAVLVEYFRDRLLLKRSYLFAIHGQPKLVLVLQCDELLAHGGDRRRVIQALRQYAVLAEAGIR